MTEQFDTDTGEIAPISQRATAAAFDERRVRRAEDRGHGLRIYAKLARAYQNIDATLGRDAEGGRNIRYTTLRKIIESVRAPLMAQGIIIRQGTESVFCLSEGGGGKAMFVPVYTDLIDADTGEVMRTKMDMPIANAQAQAIGSAVTYGRRYTLLAALGISTATKEDDDDGEAAQPRDIDDETPADRLIAAMKATKDLTAYLKWRESAGKAIDNLGSNDFEKVKQAALAHRQKLFEAQEAEPEAKPAQTKAPKGNGKDKPLPEAPALPERIPATHAPVRAD